MTKKLERDQVAGDLAAVTSMLNAIPAGDILGRIGFEARREELFQSLQDLTSRPEFHAAAALFFTGGPVIGTQGIRGDFAGGALTRFQDVVAKVLADRQGGSLAQRGVVPHREAAALHLTNIARGSFGLLLEELDDNPQKSMLETELKAAVDETARIVGSFADSDEEPFAAFLVKSNPRVFDAVADFFKFMSGNGAGFRLVSGDLDRAFGSPEIAMATERAISTRIVDDEEEFEGELRGVLPEAHRFEFRVSPGGETIEGAVSTEISSEALLHLFTDLAGRRSLARMQVRRIERPARRPRVSYVLLSAQPDG